MRLSRPFAAAAGVGLGGSPGAVRARRVRLRRAPGVLSALSWPQASCAGLQRRKYQRLALHVDNPKRPAFPLEDEQSTLYLRAGFSVCSVAMYVFHLSAAAGYLDGQINYRTFSYFNPITQNRKM